MIFVMKLSNSLFLWFFADANHKIAIFRWWTLPNWHWNRQTLGHHQNLVGKLRLERSRWRFYAAVTKCKCANSASSVVLLQWANYHKDDPIPTEDDENKENRNDDISPWDAAFLKVDQSKRISKEWNLETGCFTFHGRPKWHFERNY